MTVKFRISLISIVTFCFISYSFISAQDSLLNKQVNIKFKNTTLKQAFQKIEILLNCYFTYEGSTINPEKKINRTFKTTTLKICLDNMLEDSNLVYKVIDNHVIIKKKRIENQKAVVVDSLPQFIVLRGKVFDNQDEQSLPFASVNIINHSLGAVCNSEGEFILKIPLKMINEQVCIACLGYKNLFIPLDEYIGTFTIFKLERSFISIQEVIIRKTDPKALIRNCMRKIETNYSTKPSYLTGFYREYVKKRNNFMFFSEAVVKAYKTSYTRQGENDYLKVLKSRKMQDLKQEDTVSLKLKSGLGACLDLDLIKNPIHFLEEDNFEMYNYNMTDIVTFNDRNAYLVEFEQKPYINEALFQGKIYIDISKMAIIGVDFQVNPKKISNAQSNYVVKKNRGIRVGMTNIEYKVNYKLFYNKYYLNSVKGILNMKVKKKGKIFPIDFETSLELTINEIDTLNIERFKRNEVENLRTIFFNDIHEYDEAFWENYNFMKPEETLQESIRKLSLKKY